MLTTKKQAFIECYKSTHNATESALKAGYSAKTARVQGSRLLQDVDVKPIFDEIKALDRDKLTKETFVDIAMNKFKSVNNEHVKPRYLELAGKGAGILGNSDSSSHTTNNIQVNVLALTEVNSLPTAAKLDYIKKLLSE